MNAPTNALATAAAVATLCDDILFAVTAERRLDTGTLRALAARREGAYATALAGGPRAGVEDWEPWLLALCTAIAPIVAPRWMPMSRAVDAGLSLEHGARGLRSLFTTEPSDKDVARVRAVGAFAVRALGAVLGADGTFDREERVLRASLIASLGISPQDERLLDAEAPLDPELLDVPLGIASKIALSVVRGSFYAAMASGLDPREEQAVEALGRKLRLDPSDVASARAEAREMVDGAGPFGDAAVDAIRFQVEGEGGLGAMLGSAAMRLTLPPVLWLEQAKAMSVGMPVGLARKHHIDRVGSEGVLALAWAAVLRSNPTHARRCEHAARHERLADDLGVGAEARGVRAVIEAHVEDALCPMILHATA